VQLVGGTAQPLFRDSQIRAYLRLNIILIVVLTAYQFLVNGDASAGTLREVVFNVTSVITGTGFASVDYQLWGAFPVVVFFFIGLVGGCAGSTCCSVKIFRYQLLFASVKVQISKIHSPNGVFTPRFEGRAVTEDVLYSVMAFFVAFVVSLGILAMLLSATGLDFTTSLSGAATALANIGPGLGDIIGPAGNFAPLNDTAKWLLAAGMLAGRLELMVVFAIFTTKFWRG
jgi:trk/ktr system potassium uptake protein